MAAWQTSKEAGIVAKKKKDGEKAGIIAKKEGW